MKWLGFREGLNIVRAAMSLSESERKHLMRRVEEEELKTFNYFDSIRGK